MKSLLKSLTGVSLLVFSTIAASQVPTQAGTKTSQTIFDKAKLFFQLADLWMIALFILALLIGSFLLFKGGWGLYKEMQKPENDPNKSIGKPLGFIVVSLFFLGFGTFMAVGTNTVNDENPEAQGHTMEY